MPKAEEKKEMSDKEKEEDEEVTGEVTEQSNVEEISKRTDVINRSEVDGQNSGDKNLYEIRLSVIGCEPKKLWIKSTSRDKAAHHVKYNIHPRATVQSIILTSSLPERVSTVHEVSNGDVTAKRIRT